MSSECKWQPREAIPRPVSTRARPGPCGGRGARIFNHAGFCGTLPRVAPIQASRSADPIPSRFPQHPRKLISSLAPGRGGALSCQRQGFRLAPGPPLKQASIFPPPAAEIILHATPKQIGTSRYPGPVRRQRLVRRRSVSAGHSRRLSSASDGQTFPPRPLHRVGSFPSRQRGPLQKGRGCLPRTELDASRSRAKS